MCIPSTALRCFLRVVSRFPFLSRDKKNSSIVPSDRCALSSTQGAKVEGANVREMIVHRYIALKRGKMKVDRRIIFLNAFTHRVRRNVSKA